VSQPRWSEDGRSLLFLLEDDRNEHLARMPAAGGPVERIVTGRRVISGMTSGPDGRIAVVASTPEAPGEVFAVEPGGMLRALSHQNEDWLGEVSLAQVDEISFPGRDGTRGEYHTIRRPSFVRDRLQRYAEWYDKHLK
jgi:dipeptidyl aminopeptidase/acylaminoacyl peptidase